jgi:hypothetical protein
VAWPHDREVAMVERRDVRQLEALSQRDHGRVDRPERKARVGVHELGDPPKVSGGQLHEREQAGSVISSGPG